MKKIATIIAMVFITIFANAQKIDNKEGHFFKVGGYTFECTSCYSEPFKCGVYTLYHDDYAELKNLATFIKNNKLALEKKCGVVIEDLDYGYSDSHYKYVVFMTVYEYEGYIKHKEFKKWQKETQAREKAERMNSLNNIF